MKSIKSLAVIIVLTLLCSAPAFSAVTYNAVSGGSWTTPSTWSPSGTPTEVDAVYLTNTSLTAPVYISSGQTGTADYIYLGTTTGDRLDVSGTLDMAAGGAYNGIFFGQWGSTTPSTESHVFIKAGANVDLGQIWNSQTNTTAAASRFKVEGGTLDVGSITLGGNLLAFELTGGTFTLTTSSISGVSGAKLSINIAGGTLVIKSSLFTSLVSTGAVIKANGTVVNSGNQATLLDVVTVGSNVQVTLSYHQQYPHHAYNPSPVQNSTNIPLSSGLSWSAGDGAVSHDVYFGFSESDVTHAQRLAGDINGDRFVNIDDLAILVSQWLTNPGAALHSADIQFSSKVDLEDFVELAADWHAAPPTAFRGNQTGATFNPGTLAENTPYYWRIDEVNNSDADSPYLGNVWTFRTKPLKTVVSIVNKKWHINGVPTHQGKAAEGLLMNVRMVNSVFEDARNPSQWPAVMSGFNPDTNTTTFINKIPEYFAQGIRAFTVSLQGGMPGETYEGAWNSAYNADGTLRQSYIDRVKRVIDACNDQGMVVILSCFYQRQHSKSPTYLPYALSGKTAIRNAVQNVANWIKNNNFQNVVLEIANEYPHSGYVNWNDGSWLMSHAGQVELINLAKATHTGLLVSTSALGDGTINSSVATAADFIILHFNNSSVGTYASRITTVKAYQKAILCNEDDKFNNDGATALQYSVDNGCGWGFMQKYINQFAPFQYLGRLDDTAVYDRLELLTGGSYVPPLPVQISVTITYPNDGNAFNAGSNITIMADPLPSEGKTITKVEFFANSSKIGERTSSPWQFAWQNVPAGTYILTAKATDSGANQANSSPVDIYVTAP
jgi:hypothetical protein